MELSLLRHNGVWQPLAGTQYQGNFSYLHERQHKRELRLESAKEGTLITASQHEDLERNMLFSLRSMFVQTLEAKAVLDLAKADLDYYDKIIDISRTRFQAGDIARIDLDRIELLRVQYEAEIETATVNLRTAKFQLMQFINERTPVEKFDVTGNFDWSDVVKPLEDYHQIALDNRPDLRAAIETIQQSDTNHKLAVSNGSTDPTYSAWATYNPSFNNPNDKELLAQCEHPIAHLRPTTRERRRGLCWISIAAGARPMQPRPRSSTTWIPHTSNCAAISLF